MDCRIQPVRALCKSDQFLLLPTTAQGLSLLPGTATQLFGSSQRASALVTPQQSLYYGGRILSAAGQTSLSYAATSRLNIGAGFRGQPMQHINNNQAVNQGPFLFPAKHVPFGKSVA